MFAFLDLNPAKLAQFAVNLLAVVGGFLAGQCATAFALWLIDKKLTRGKAPPQLKQAGAILGGIAAALAVALIVFGHGEGWTLMGGGGSADGNGPPATAATGGPPPATAPTTPPTDPTPRVPPPTKPLPPSYERVRITLLGGEDVRDERFYLLDDDATPRKLSDVRAALLAKKDAAGKPVGVEVRFAERNTLPPDHAAVTRLTGWAQAHGLTVTFPADAP